MRIITDFGDVVQVENYYRMRCWQPHPKGVMCRDGIRRLLDWQMEFKNLVVAAGLEHSLRRVMSGETIPTFNDGTLDSVRGRRYPGGRRAPRAWTTGTKAVGDICQPTAPGANGHIFLCITGGASGGSEPTWNTSAGATTTDGSAVWQEASRLFIGLKAAGTVAATDRMDSHSGWSEITSYSESTRQAFVPGTITSNTTNNTASAASFTMTAGATVAGAFLTDIATKGATTGLLIGAGDMTTAVDALASAIVDVIVTPTYLVP